MYVRYKGGAEYVCNHLSAHQGLPACQYIRALRIDAVVAQAFLTALAPAEIDALSRARRAQQQADKAMRSGAEQQLQRRRYEAALAERQFNRVDPDNRLVAAELERRWEAALMEVRAADRLAVLFAQYPALFVAITGATVVFVQMISNRDRARRSGSLSPPLVPGAFLLAEAGLLVLVLKHFGVKYLLPALPAAWVLMAWLVRFGSAARADRQIWAAAPLLAAVAALGGGAWRTLHTQTDLAAIHARKSAELVRLERVLGQHPKRAVIAEYAVPLVGHALLFSLGYTRSRFAAEALAMRPNEFMWRGGVNMLTQPIGDWFPLSHVNNLQERGLTVLFVALSSTQISGLQLTAIGEYGSIRVFRVDGVAP